MGRRPIKLKTYSVRSRLLHALGLRARFDVVAQQVLDHDAGIFKAVKENDLSRALELVHTDGGTCLGLRDSVGATPIHVAFLYGHYELGKTLVLERKDLAALTYSTLTTIGPRTELSPYEGENVLHIAIVQRDRRLAKWLLDRVPELIKAETVGNFFRPGKPCYFGGTPLLFALASNQIDIALDILEAAESLSKLPKLKAQRTVAVRQLRQQQRALFQQLDPSAFAQAATRNVKKILPVAISRMASASGLIHAEDEGEEEEEDVETTIFMTDSFGNNVLHLAVIHDLPQVFGFAIQFAILVLGHPGFTIADIDLAVGEKGSQEAYDSVASLNAPVGQEVMEDARSRARVAAFTSSPPASPLTGSASKLKRESLVDFLKRVDDVRHDKMMRGFFLQRNRDELTPLSLAAALGKSRMFQYILQQVTSVAWSYGPITALNILLLDLDEPVPRPRVHHGRLEPLHKIMTMLPYPLTPQGRKGYRTAIQCMCSLEKLSCTISKADYAGVLENRLEMLKLIEVHQLLAKKWKYVGKRLFRTRFWLYTLFLLAFNASTLFHTDAYREATVPVWRGVALALCEIIAYGFAVVKFVNESHQMLFSFRAYVTEAGAGRLDNVCTLLTSLCMFAAGFARLHGAQEWNDAFTAVALIMAWFYQFFFLLGFRTTGPFVIMILTMIQNDIVRFVLVYFSVMAGFSQAVYLVADGRVGLTALFHRGRMLVIAGFTGEINYDDNYTSGRMNGLTQLIMLGYVILVMILLVNLLIAMMGNTYADVLAKSEQRWVAERANIMATIENQLSVGKTHAERRRYAVPLVTRGSDKEEMFLQLEINNIETWKRQGTNGTQDDNNVK
jgi:hypothetical protein